MKKMALNSSMERIEAIDSTCVRIAWETSIVLPLKPAPASTFQQGGTMTYTGLDLVWSRKKGTL